MAPFPSDNQSISHTFLEGSTADHIGGYYLKHDVKMFVIDDDAGVIEQFTTDAVHPTAFLRSESQSKIVVFIRTMWGNKATNDAVKSPGTHLENYCYIKLTTANAATWRAMYL